MKREALLAVAAAIFGLAFTGFVVHYSELHGRLAFPPDYDDSHSLVEGALRWLTWNHDGFAGAWAEYLQRLPHSFLHYYFAALVFALFGIRDTAVYWCNGVFLVATLSGLISLLGSGYPLRTLALLVAFLCIPAAFNLIFDFRSECALAALLFAACCALIRAAWSPGAYYRWSAVAGTLLALGLGIKPAMFPYTLGMAAGASFLLALCARFQDAGRRAIAWRSLAVIWTLMIVPFAFHYVLNWDWVAGYILNNAFKSDLYKQSGTLHDQLVYHFLGFPGRFQLGPYAWPLLAVTVTANLAAGFLPAAPHLRRHLFGCTFLTAVAYAGVAVNAMVQNYFGMTFHFLLSASALVGIAWFAALLPPRAGSLLCVLTAVLAMGAWRVPLSQDYVERTRAESGPAGILWRRDGPARVFDAIRPYWRVEGAPIVWFAAYGWTDANTVGWEAVRQQLHWKMWNYYELQPEPGRLFPGTAEIVIVPEPGLTGTIELPCNQHLTPIRQMLDRNPDAALIAQVTDPGGKTFRIYRIYRRGGLAPADTGRAADR